LREDVRDGRYRVKLGPLGSTCGGRGVRIGQAVDPRPEARPRPRPARRVVGVRVVGLKVT
jgi:hypothetical protein